MRENRKRGKRVSLVEVRTRCESWIRRNILEQNRNCKRANCINTCLNKDGKGKLISHARHLLANVLTYKNRSYLHSRCRVSSRTSFERGVKIPSLSGFSRKTKEYFFQLVSAILKGYTYICKIDSARSMFIMWTGEWINSSLPPPQTERSGFEMSKRPEERKRKRVRVVGEVS